MYSHQGIIKAALGVGITGLTRFLIYYIYIGVYLCVPRCLSEGTGALAWQELWLSIDMDATSNPLQILWLNVTPLLLFFSSNWLFGMP